MIGECARCGRTVPKDVIICKKCASILGKRMNGDAPKVDRSGHY